MQLGRVRIHWLGTYPILNTEYKLSKKEVILFKVVKTLEVDEDGIVTTLYSAIPQSWFSSDANCASTNFLFPPPEMAVAGLTAYNWAYNTFRRYFYPDDDWMEYTANAVESGKEPG